MSRLLNESEAQKFRALVDSYRLNPDVIEQFKNSNFAVVAGPAGAGKDTLRDELIKKYPNIYVPIMSTTTRPPRIGETDGITYRFREINQVERDLKDQKFFQIELVHNQQISGLDVNEIRKLSYDQIGLSILIVETEKKLSVIKSDIKTVFLIPPSLKILKERMVSERLLNPQEVDRRLNAAKQEIVYALGADHYYCIISDTVEHVVGEAHAYLKEGLKNSQDDRKARAVMQKIMLELSNER
jgi:guanylate kinase